MISVIIPIYNAEKYLPRTIKCLQNQIYSYFEVLLLDDGSVDSSGEICKKVVETDHRFIYHYQENGGVSAARNNGLKLSKGEYITFIDADDEIPENYLSELYEILVENNCQMSVCDVAVYKNGKELNRFTSEKERLTSKTALNYILTRKNINSGPYAKLFRREILEKIEFPSLKAYEDILFVVKAVEKCVSVAITNKTEYKYIQNEGSAMSTFMKIPSKDIIIASDYLLDFINENNILDPMCFYITASHLMQYVIPLVNIINDSAKEFINEARKIYKKHKFGIIKCKAFPPKERATYLLFAYGWFYNNRKIIRLK